MLYGDGVFIFELELRKIWVLYFLPFYQACPTIVTLPTTPASVQTLSFPTVNAREGDRESIHSAL